ncbi:hypothetical protein M758_UG239300 [Ceratodon purpureus]|nr:hypothetical protein M758_UG239300 [Ceratodon purpureus]
MALQWDWVLTEQVLENFLGQKPVSPWDMASPPWALENPLRRSSISDVDNARATCKMWRGIIDMSTEWACIRLAQWDYAQESGAHWVTREEFEVSTFAMNWAVFGKSWRMLVPIQEERLKLAPIGSLTCLELDALRALLRSSGNEEILLAPGEKLNPADDVWVCKDERAWFQI